MQTFDISSLDYFISINSLKFLRPTPLSYKDTEIRKSDFVAKTQLLLNDFFAKEIERNPTVNRQK